MKSIRNVYVHIPFCAKKCIYCDFPIQAIGNNPEHREYFQQMQNGYIDKLIEEIKWTLTKDKFDLSKLETIYIGGGTPSLLSPNNFARLSSTIIKSFDSVDKEFEFSVENEPDSVRKEIIDAYKDIGVNRLTLGVQTFHDKSLKFLNRNHSVADVHKAVELIAGSYFLKDLGMDVLLGVANENTENLLNTIDKITDIKLGHISAYILTVEKHTKLSDLVEKGNVRFKDEVLGEQYVLSQQYLKSKGFEQYEVSNYFSPENKGQKSRHNTMYWKGDTDFFGFGMGAASLINSHRFTRPTSLKKYYQFVSELQSGGISIERLGDNEAFNLSEKLKVVLMGGLRTTKGIEVDRVKDYFNTYSRPELFEPFIKSLNQLAKLIEGRLIIDSETIKVPHEHFIVLNSILQEIFVIIESICKPTN